MEISKILNPSAGANGGGKPPPKVKSGEDRSAGQTGSKEWEEKMRKKGMPTEGLNTFRVKKA